MDAFAIEAGGLRHRPVLQTRSPQPDGGGGELGDPWAAPVTVATLWGRIEPLGGAERLQAMKLESRVTHRISIRYRLGIIADMRLVQGTRIFNIRAVIDTGERRRVLELLCEEGTAT